MQDFYVLTAIKACANFAAKIGLADTPAEVAAKALSFLITDLDRVHYPACTTLGGQKC